MFSRRSIFCSALASVLLGVGGYAYLTPSFASSAKKSAARVQGWTDSAKASLTNTALYSSVAKELRERPGKNYIQPAIKLPDIYHAFANKLPKRVPPTCGQSAATRVLCKPPPEIAQPPRSAQSIGQQIADGHAFSKHGHELGLATKAQMASQIDRIIAHPSCFRHLRHGRTAYWDNATKTVVIQDPNTQDGGTTFKPRGKSYFDNLQ